MTLKERVEPRSIGTRFTREFIEDLGTGEHSMKVFQWTVTEDIQDHEPYVEWGWAGFVPGIIFRS
jgi:hypothetical protein